MKNRIGCFIVMAIASMVVCGAELKEKAVDAEKCRKFLSVSDVDPRYFADSDGRTFIMIGCNICFDRLYDGKGHGDAEVRANFDRWLRNEAYYLCCAATIEQPFDQHL